MNLFSGALSVHSSYVSKLCMVLLLLTMLYAEQVSVDIYTVPIQYCKPQVSQFNI